jgi:transcriptional regulator with XRE-family HTH domain
METMGNRIAAMRREKGLKQEELAELLDVSPQAVSKWENDQTCPDISLLMPLAGIFDCTADYILSGKKEESPAVALVPEEKRKDMKDMILRIIVDSAAGDRVRVNLPVALLQAAIDMNLQIPQITGSDALQSIDLNQILQLVRQGAVGDLVEVESAGGDNVRIFVE